MIIELTSMSNHCLNISKLRLADLIASPTPISSGPVRNFGDDYSFHQKKKCELAALTVANCRETGWGEYSPERYLYAQTAAKGCQEPYK